MATVTFSAAEDTLYAYLVVDLAREISVQYLSRRVKIHRCHGLSISFVQK